MIIHNVVAHELIKEVDIREASMTLNPNGVFLRNDAIVHEFVSSIDTAYNKKPKALGRFDEDSENYKLQNHLQTYLKKSIKTDEDFLDLTEKAMEILVHAAKNEVKAIGGIVIFMHYDDQFMVLLLKRRKMFDIKNFKLGNLNAIDIDFMRYATKIDVNTLLDITAEDPYISYIRGTATKVADYYTEFIGCKDYAPPKRSTQQMVKALRDYMKSLGYGTEKKREIESQVLSYGKSQLKLKEPIRLASISAMMETDDNITFIEYINSNKIVCPEVFDADNTELNKLRRYSYKTKEWSISFEHSLWGGTVTYIPDDAIIIIKDVPSDFTQSLDIIQADNESNEQ